MSKVIPLDEGYAADGSGAVWMEENLCLWPLFSMRSKGGRQVDGKVETHTVNLFTLDAEENQVAATLTLRGAAGIGLPRYWDQDAMFAVEELLYAKGGPDRDGGLNFSIAELIRLVGTRKSGNVYDRMKDSLDRIGSTRIISDKAFYNPITKTLISDRFNLWSVRFREEQDHYSRHLREQHRLDFHKNFLDAYRGGHGGFLDRDFYWGLQYPTSKRLYRLLSSQFVYRNEWEVDLFTLRDLMMVNSFRHASRIKQAMAKANGELKARGFLRSVEERKLEDGSKVLVYKNSKKYVLRTREQRVLNDPEKQVAYLILKEHGVWRSSRLTLIEEHGASRCIEASEAMARQRNVRDPGAWLADALRNGYDLEGPEDEDESEPSLPEARDALPDDSRVGASDADQDNDIILRDAEDFSGTVDVDITGSNLDKLRLAGDNILDTSRPHYDGSDGKADKVWCSLVEEYAAGEDAESTITRLLQFVGYRLDDDALLVVVAPDQGSADELIQSSGGRITQLWKDRRGAPARIVVDDYERVRAELEKVGDDPG